MITYYKFPRFTISVFANGVGIVGTPEGPPAAPRRGVFFSWESLDLLRAISEVILTEKNRADEQGKDLGDT
jgi:hypothetical protein